MSSLISLPAFSDDDVYKDYGKVVLRGVEPDGRRYEKRITFIYVDKHGKTQKKYSKFHTGNRTTVDYRYSKRYSSSKNNRSYSKNTLRPR